MFDSLLKQKNYTRFIVLSRSRTGSNLLLNSLNMHPHIHAFGEVFRGGVNDGIKAEVLKSAENYLDKNIFKYYDKSIHAVGFKIFYQHPVWDQSGNVWNCLQGMDNLKVIHLKRNNILRSLVSQKIAFKTDVWKETDAKDGSSPLDRKVRLSKEECEENFKKTRAQEAAGDKMFCNHEVLQISYEDLTNDYQDQMQRALAFLNVSTFELQPQTLRQNPEPLRDLLINYDQLREEFVGSPWQEFFG